MQQRTNEFQKMQTRHDELLCRISALEIQLMAKDKKIEEL